MAGASRVPTHAAATLEPYGSTRLLPRGGSTTFRAKRRREIARIGEEEEGEREVFLVTVDGHAHNTWNTAWQVVAALRESSSRSYHIVYASLYICILCIHAYIHKYICMPILIYTYNRYKLLHVCKDACI